MKENNQNNTNGKKRYTFRVSDEVMDLVYKWYQDDNCSTLNEFIEKAIRFYAGYVASERKRNAKSSSFGAVCKP